MTNSEQNLKRILLIGTGGTITAKFDNGTWVPGKLTENDLIQFVPEIKVLAKLTTINLFNIDSVCMQPKYWVKIAQTIQNNYEAYEAFIITHGTDTLHYTAAALSFLIQNPTKPIILTGSMIPPYELGTDAKWNLLDAVRVATETNIHEVVIVFNHKVLRGNRAKKFREVEFDAYQSIGKPPIAMIEKDIRYTGTNYRQHSDPSQVRFFNQMELEVCIQKLTPGYNPMIIDKLIALGYKGIITEGFGSGNIPISENSLLDEITNATKKKIPIIVCSQCAIGFSWMDLYESGKKALEAGGIPGYDMISETAMVKLMWILGNFPEVSIQRIKDLILTDMAGEISKLKSPKEKRVWEYAF